jgi:hypothetical protein
MFLWRKTFCGKNVSFPRITSSSSLVKNQYLEICPVQRQKQNLTTPTPSLDALSASWEDE